VRAGEIEPGRPEAMTGTDATVEPSAVEPVPESIPTYTAKHIRQAWAVHTLTASGVFVGILGLNAVIEGHARGAILWLIVALIVDGVDGPIARHLDVRNRIPTVDGNSLDLIIDYFTCTIVPVAFLDRFDFMPNKMVGPIGFAILFVSALWMARTDQDGPGGWFNGFPAEWNMILPTLFLLDTSAWFSLIVCVVFCGLTLSRVPFPHPVSVREHRGISLFFMTIWLGSMTTLAIVQRPVLWLRILLAIGPLWSVAQVIHRQLNPADPATPTRHER
jgi:phosphatidylcholine synthase